MLECDIFPHPETRTGWLHHHGGSTVIYRVICAAASVAHHFCAFPVSKSVVFVDLSPSLRTLMRLHSAWRKDEQIVLNAKKRCSGANNRHVSWNKMDRGDHHLQAWTAHHGWLHRAISLSRGHLIFQAGQGHLAKHHLDGRFMSLGRLIVLYFDHWNQWQGMHTESYKAHLKLYLWCCPLQERVSWGRGFHTSGGYLWRLQRAPFLLWSGVVRSPAARSARLYQLLLGVVALCELLNPSKSPGSWGNWVAFNILQHVQSMFQICCTCGFPCWTLLGCVPF